MVLRPTGRDLRDPGDSDGALLKILIEKDLECIDATVEESQEDAFPRLDHGVACSSTSIPVMEAAHGVS